MEQGLGKPAAGEAPCLPAGWARRAARSEAAAELAAVAAKTVATCETTDMIDYTDHDVDPYDAPIPTTDMRIDPMGRE